MENIVFFLLLNAVLSVIYLILMLRKKQKCVMVLWFFALPILGFVLYYVPQWISKMMGFLDYDRESLVRRLDIQKGERLPSTEIELDVVAIEDAMAVSDNKKKRLLLLNQLKKDYLNNYKEILGAENDTDSESAHYVASAKMEIYSIHQKEWISKQKEYEENPTEDIFEELMEMLARFINGELLSGQEKQIYKKRYILLVETKLSDEDEWWNEVILTNYLKFLFDIGESERALAFWNDNMQRLANEDIFIKILEVFYNKRDKKNFQYTLQKLKEDDSIQLSSDGLAMLRYWLKRM